MFWPGTIEATERESGREEGTRAVHDQFLNSDPKGIHVPDVGDKLLVSTTYIQAIPFEEVNHCRRGEGGCQSL